MAERRMFAKTIIDSDAFLDMPSSTQALYFHLVMRANNKGELNNANAHHIKHFATHINLRYDLDNGITLCPSCHKEVHQKERDKTNG